MSSGTDEPNQQAPAKPPRQIAVLMPKLMAAVGAVPRGHRNRAQNYKYRSIDDLQAALQPALIKYGLVLRQTIRKYKLRVHAEDTKGGGSRLVSRARVWLAIDIIAPDGSGVAIDGVGEGMDYNGDKASSKAMVAAWKYAVTLGLSIPVEDTVDADGDAPPKEQAKAAPKQAPPKSAKALDATPNPYVGHDHDKATPARVDEIKQLAKSLDMGAHALKAELAGVGAASLVSITEAQADHLLGILKSKRLEQEAAQVF